jgi:hypothetical protein
VPLLTAKGGKTHRRRGTIYFWAMAVVAITAMVLALWFPILFLAFVAVFSFHFASCGYRVLFRKRPLHGQGSRGIDWAAAVLASLGSLALIALGIVWPIGLPGIFSIAAPIKRLAAVRYRSPLAVTTKKLSRPTIKRGEPYTMPVAGRVKCRAAGVLHRKLDFAWQAGIRRVLHSHPSVWKPASIRQLRACRGDAGL